MDVVLYMLSAERIGELPLDVRMLIAKADIEVYIRLYLWDKEFRLNINHNWFKKQIIIEKYDNFKAYKINNIECVKYKKRQWWYKNKKLHKLDGPAVTFSNMYQAYYIDGILQKYQTYNIQKKYNILKLHMM